jgi:hypothetical protein
VVAGRLRIAAGGALILEDVGMPLALSVEAGEAMVNVVAAEALAAANAIASSPTPSSRAALCTRRVGDGIGAEPEH